MTQKNINSGVNIHLLHVKLNNFIYSYKNICFIPNVLEQSFFLKIPKKYSYYI